MQLTNISLPPRRRARRALIIQPDGHYRGTPYALTSAHALSPLSATASHELRWFAFTPDLTKLTVGGVDSFEQLKTIIDYSIALEQRIEDL